MAAAARGRDASPMTAASRVLVVDDHPAVRQGIDQMLGDEPAIVCVGTVATAGEAHARWPAREWAAADVVLVDRHLPDEDGLSLCLWLATRAPAPAVVIYSAFADEALALPAIVAGAAAVVAKSSDPRELCAVLRAVASGERRLPAVTAPVGALQAARLAPEDLPILGMLRHGVPPDEIAATLRIDEATLVARRWAMLEALSTPPDRRGEPRPVPRIQAIRTLSSATATTSPGWS
jgi:DNA-binding NarL/FixJ family response regulator